MHRQALLPPQVHHSTRSLHIRHFSNGKHGARWQIPVTLHAQGSRPVGALRINPARRLGAESKESFPMACTVVSGSPKMQSWMWMALAVPVLAGHAAGAGKEGNMGVDLAKVVGQVVELEGRPAVAIWQHLVGSVGGKLPEYVDLAGGQQIVAHVAGGLPCPGAMVLRGTVLEVRGGPKRPGLPPSKADEVWIEHALDVDSVVCVPSADELPGLIERLADPALEPDAKRAEEERLVAAGMAAVPLLLEHLEDRRVVGGECHVSNFGEMTNRPYTPDPPAPEAVYVAKVVTAGERCRWMLGRIVAPRNYRSPREHQRKPVSPGEGGLFFQVDDWRGFFARRAGQPLDAIRAELQPVLDRYFEAGGVVQPVK